MIIKSHQVVFAEPSKEQANPDDNANDLDNHIDANEILAREILDDAKTKAGDLLEQAENQALKIKEEAKDEMEIYKNSIKEEAEKIKSEALNEGFEEGKAQGFDEGFKEGTIQAKEEAREETEKLLNDANNIKSDILRSKERLARDLEDDIVHMVYVIFEKIVRQLTEEDESLIVSMVSEGIKKLNSENMLTIITSKKDYEYLMLHGDEIKEKLDITGEINLKYDSEMENGDCLVETSKGNIDISLMKQLTELKFFLKEIIDSEA